MSKTAPAPKRAPSRSPAARTAAAETAAATAVVDAIPERDGDYPKQMYGPKGKTRRVEDADAEKALGKGWQDAPYDDGSHAESR